VSNRTQVSSGRTDTAAREVAVIQEENEGNLVGQRNADETAIGWLSRVVELANLQMLQSAVGAQ